MEEREGGGFSVQHGRVAPGGSVGDRCACGGGGLVNTGGWWATRGDGQLIRRPRREGGPGVSGGVWERVERCGRVDVSRWHAGPGFK
jgi:hypothetical protein